MSCAYRGSGQRPGECGPEAGERKLCPKAERLVKAGFYVIISPMMYDSRICACTYADDARRRAISKGKGSL